MYNHEFAKSIVQDIISVTVSEKEITVHKLCVFAIFFSLTSVLDSI